MTMRGFYQYDELKRFIYLVKHHPPLYDPSAKVTNLSTADIWANITEEMRIPSMRAADWKCKWKCLRDTFVKKAKDIRSAETEDLVVKAKNWRFYKPMLFLDPFIDRGSKKCRIPKSDGHDYQHYTIIKNNDYAEGDFADEEEASYSFVNQSAYETSPDPTPSKRRRQNETTVMDDLEMEAINEDCEELQSNSNSMEGSNSRSFFMSCAYRMDKLPEKMQSYLQLQISQLFFNAENPDVPPVTIMPLPTHSSSKNYKS